MLVKILIPAAVMLLGAAIYLIAGSEPNSGSRSGKYAEIGRLMFFAGLFWTVYISAQHSLSI
ncbi:MAG TPA: hypothetical protein VGP64_17995 [Polyangia bacterium]|jgi:Na+/H+ antiporter NhaD/arsenite permease-like protein